MKRVLLIIATMAAPSAYAGIFASARIIPALDEFGLIALAVLVGTVGARAVRRFRGRRKTDD